MNPSAVVLRMGLCNIQVCVPASWSVEEIEAWVNHDCPAGTQHGWRFYDEPCHDGSAPRITCAADKEKVHVILSC